MTKTKKQVEPRPPRPLIPEEVLILFLVDAGTPPVDDDFFEGAFEYLGSDLPDSVWMGSWKCLRVPNLQAHGQPRMNGGVMRLPGPVVDELQRWGDAQANPDSLRIVRIRTLTDVNGYAIVIRSQEVAEPAEELSSAQVGGKEYHVGQSMSPEKFEDFFKAILSENPGPVTIESEDNVTGAQVSTRVGDWADFTGGPATNKVAHESQVDDLTRTGYLAFEEVAPGKVQSKIPYQVLTPQYFRDFDRFLRCQEIPARYFQPVSAGPACFISHRWASPQHPDPSGSQFRLLKGFSERNNSKLIWYDYSCLPQPPLSVPERAAFRESIHYLNSLVMTAEFVSIVTGDYITRAWCYYEWVVS